MQQPQKKDPRYESDIKKIKKIYENYGIDTSDMSEEELDRIYHEYKRNGRSIEGDVKESDKYSSILNEDDIIG